MEFEAAAQRLANDQSKWKNRAARQSQNRVVSQKAKREAEFRKRQQEQRHARRQAEQRAADFQQQYYTQCERALGTQCLATKGVDSTDSGTGPGGGLTLQATSIHGDGDKVALPPSILQLLTEKSMVEERADASSPWTFRIGILRSGYSFPSSSLIRVMRPSSDDDEDDGAMAYSDNEEDEISREAFLNELSHKYIAYTHGTVVEFTQDEGHVGLPASIAKRLLADFDGGDHVPTMRTQDPAGNSVERDNFIANDADQTPGHLAWDAFDLPSLPVEVTLVNLPKGRECTLIPSKEAIVNGFHQLKDVKLVLEQSLIRTRATLSVGDTVHTWHRGKKFALSVASVSPDGFGAVSCINTDIEVDIGLNEEMENMSGVSARASPMDNTMADTSSSFAPGAGHKLTDESPDGTPASPPEHPQTEDTLLSEPPVDQKDGVCTIQLRTPSGTGRRRFDVNQATLKDLFAYAAYVANTYAAFQLVTRFPRRVVSLNDDTRGQTLSDAGISAGQEMFLLEQL